MDLRTALAGVRCPTLIMAGEQYPMTPMASSETIAAQPPAHLPRFERFDDCGHGAAHDQPEGHFAALREFMLS